MSTRDEGTPVWIGLDLGGTKMLSVVYDESFQALGRERKKTKGNEGAEAGLQRLTSAIRQAVKKCEVDGLVIQGIGVGCPGMLDLSAGVLQDAPNLGWKDVPLVDKLHDEFGCPVLIGNDVDFGVYGESQFGAGRDKRCVVGIFPGTGIGGGCVYEGKILSGTNITCMEIGHIPMIAHGPLDGCGREGTLEGLASRLSVAAQAAAAAYRGQAPSLLRDVGTEVSEIRSGALAKSIEEGDEAVKQIVLQAARYIGRAAITVIHLLAPDVIVLGGGLVEAMPKLIVDEVERVARDGVLPAFRDVFQIVPATLGDDAVVQGAAAWARHRIAGTPLETSST